MAMAQPIGQPQALPETVPVAQPVAPVTQTPQLGAPVEAPQVQMVQGVSAMPLT